MIVQNRLVEQAMCRQRLAGKSTPSQPPDEDQYLMTPETIAHVQHVVSERGCDAWWTSPIEDLLPPNLAHLAPSLVRGRDTMDVWFDSGTSWAGVL